MKMYQMMQYVVCTLIIVIKYVSYSVRFCLILQPMYHEVYSTNIAFTALQQKFVLHNQSFIVSFQQISYFTYQTDTF